MTTKTSKSVLEQLAATVSVKTRDRFEEQSAQGIVNPIVLAELMGVRPQMLYQYISKGKLPVLEGHEQPVGTNSTQKKVIDLAVANAFAEGYLSRKVEREAKRQAKIEAELAGEGESQEPVEAEIEA
jgi:hypothetical protein